MFYENYTDSESLYNVIKNNVCSNILETPNNLLYDNLINYSCENDNIISNQIEVAKNYGYKGFCLYYYWFSKNLFTGKNMVFKKIIDKFFKSKIDNFKIFLIGLMKIGTKKNYLMYTIKMNLRKMQKIW